MQNQLLKENNIKYVNGKKMKINSKNILDQYFTKQEIAKKLIEKTKKVILKYEKDLQEFNWIEPSAGNGVFYNLLPKEKRIGIDIKPQLTNILEKDFLKYKIDKNKRNIVIGNPPFGHRGVIALNFINHSKDAEYVCFILPMFFKSQGKGSIKYRVKHHNLLHSEELPKNSFYTPNNNKDIDVRCVFQIWSKNHKNDTAEFSWYNNRKNEPFTDLIKVYTVSLAKNRECGKKWIYDEKADFYISSTFYGNTTIVETFEQVKYKSGIAVVITTEDPSIRKKILKIFKQTDWSKYGNIATNNCYHIGKSNIFTVINDNLKKLKK